MEISNRLKCVEQLIDKCNILADIGTDHAYLPIHLIKNDMCKKVIASDINVGPVNKAKRNIKAEGMQNYIECRLGGGLSVLKPDEAQIIVIAGMGGNLISDIITDGIEILKTTEAFILQPVQNPEVLRKFLYESGFDIIDEELCEEENKFYEVIKAKYDDKPKKLNDIDYEISTILFNKKHKLLKKYICNKLKKYGKILCNINSNSLLAQQKKILLSEKIEKLEVMKKCL